MTCLSVCNTRHSNRILLNAKDQQALIVSCAPEDEVCTYDCLVCLCGETTKVVCDPGAVLGKNIWGAWPLIIWEATTAERNYYKTNYIKRVEKLDINYPEKI